jgi:hypothetical protein
MNASGNQPADAEETAGAASDALASDHDESGIPVHRGWAPIGGRHRWMEPFVLVVLATTGAHGYAITGELEEMGITGGPVDIGQVYRTLRDLEESGHVAPPIRLTKRRQVIDRETDVHGVGGWTVDGVEKR